MLMVAGTILKIGTGIGIFNLKKWKKFRKKLVSIGSGIDGTKKKVWNDGKHYYLHKRKKSCQTMGRNNGR